jgi:ABC-type sulfate transport system substrate-binding protein
MTMIRLTTAAILALSIATASALRAQTLLNVSYDPTPRHVA